MPFKLPHLNNAQQIAAGVIAFIVITMAALAGSRLRPLGTPSSTSAPTPSPTLTTAKPSPTLKATAGTKPKSTAKPPSSGTSGLSYGDAVARYDAWRIQFNRQCQARPNRMTVKNGTTVMLDNRAGSATTIVLNDVNYALPAFGFRLVTLSYQPLPQTVIAHCGRAKNVAQITVQP